MSAWLLQNGTPALSLPGDNSVLVAAAGAVYLPAYSGPRGWVGLRRDDGKIDWGEVGELRQGPNEMKAPRK